MKVMTPVVRWEQRSLRSGVVRIYGDACAKGKGKERKGVEKDLRWVVRSSVMPWQASPTPRKKMCVASLTLGFLLGQFWLGRLGWRGWHAYSM